MIIYRVKLGHAVTFTKHLDCVVSLIFLPKNLIWNKIKFSPSSLLMVNELNKSISKKKLPIFLFLPNLSLLNVKISRTYN